MSKFVELARSHASVSLFVGYHSTRSANSGTTAAVDASTRGSDFRLCSHHDCGLLRILSCGAHSWFHRLSLLHKLPERPFEIIGENYEDHSFCTRVRKLGGVIALATSVPIAHVDTAKGLAFLPFSPPQKIERGEIRPATAAEMAGVEVDMPDLHDYGASIEPAKAAEINSFNEVRRLSERLQFMSTMYELLTGQRFPKEMVANAVREKVGDQKVDAFVAGIEFDKILQARGVK